MLTLITLWLSLDVLFVAALVKHGNHPSTIRRKLLVQQAELQAREVRQLERLWVLS